MTSMTYKRPMKNDISLTFQSDRFFSKRIDKRQLQRVEVNPAIIAVAGGARGVLGVADAAAAGTHHVEKRVLLAVDVRLQEVERLAARLAFEPELVAARRPQHELAFRERFPHRELVRVGDEDDFLRIRVLHGHGNHARVARRRAGGAGGHNLTAHFLQFREIKPQLVCFFQFIHGSE